MLITRESILQRVEADAQRAAEFGVPFNPKLPRNFESTANDRRPPSHRRWWGRPFIRTEISLEPSFLDAWPSGIRYDVRCLDGGAWDRSTCWGMFATLDEAAACLRCGND